MTASTSQLLNHSLFFKKKWAYPGLFLICFRLFKHTLQFLQQINVKKCLSSIWCRDSNSQPLEHESPPITTRPGLNHTVTLKWTHKSELVLITPSPFDERLFKKTILEKKLFSSQQNHEKEKMINSDQPKSSAKMFFKTTPTLCSSF